LKDLALGVPWTCFQEHSLPNNNETLPAYADHVGLNFQLAFRYITLLEFGLIIESHQIYQGASMVGGYSTQPKSLAFRLVNLLSATPALQSLSFGLRPRESLRLFSSIIAVMLRIYFPCIIWVFQLLTLYRHP
jgi:hypothetical protein